MRADRRALVLSQDAVHDLLAIFRRERLEEGAVAGHTDDEVGILLGVGVRFKDLLLQMTLMLISVPPMALCALINPSMASMPPYSRARRLSKSI